MSSRLLGVHVLTSSEICGVVDVPTQFPTQGQWWSNLAMQRLHTAQCLDLMGFLICKETVCFIIAIILCVYHRFLVREKSEFTKQVLQNMLRSRLPVSASSTIVWRKETRNKSRILKKQTETWQKNE